MLQTRKCRQRVQGVGGCLVVGEHVCDYVPKSARVDGVDQTGKFACSSAPLTFPTRRFFTINVNEELISSEEREREVINIHP